MKIAIACGGSGGHIFPGIALAQELIKDKHEVLMICSQRPLDSEILQANSDLRFEVIPCAPFVMTLNPLKITFFFIKSLSGIYSSMRLLLRFRPGSVAGFGGFTSGPVVMAAWLLGIPSIIHEQNAVAGLANRISSFFAKRVAISFDQTKKFFNACKTVEVGNPVRSGFQQLDKMQSRERFGLDRNRFTLLVTGGSQGAGLLNYAVPDAIGLMDFKEKKSLQVIHVTGKNDYETIKEKYGKNKIKSNVSSFIHEIDRAYTAADLVVSRAGATTIAELAYFGKPSILIPYPTKRVHQAENARLLSDKDAAITIAEKDISAEALRLLILAMLKDPARCNNMAENSKRLARPDAARILAREVTALLKEKAC